MNGMFTESTTRITSTGSLAAAAPGTASNERIFSGSLLSKSVKSFCSSPETGFPDLSFTTTFRRMVLSVAGVGCTGIGSMGRWPASIDRDKAKLHVKTRQEAGMSIHLEH